MMEFPSSEPFHVCIYMVIADLQKQQEAPGRPPEQSILYTGSKIILSKPLELIHACILMVNLWSLKITAKF
jgi:hypothetical protein